MLDSIRFRCPSCDFVFHQSVAYVQGQIKAMKQGKAIEICKQLHDKRGPFYDKWLKAMKARGEQKRCKDCVDCEDHGVKGFLCVYSIEYKKINPGAFVCSHFLQDS